MIITYCSIHKYIEKDNFKYYMLKFYSLFDIIS